MVLIDVADAQSENAVARKRLRRVDEVVEAVRRHFVIRKRKERDRPFAHQAGEMRMRYAEELNAFRSARFSAR